jgi:flagellar hook-length control protein FliK
MERPTAWSAGDSGAAISNSDRSALGEEQGDNARERRSPSDAARDPSSTQAAAAGAISAATAEHAAQSAANGSAPGSLQSRMQVIEQVASRLDAMRLSQGRQEVTLQLHPDHLGELRITIVADRDNLTARVVAQTAQARHAVEEGKDQLRSALEQKGYSLQSLDVSLSQGGAGRFQAAAQQPALPVPSRAVQSPESESVSPDLPSLVPTGASQTSDGRIDYRA